ncbi:FG-GAP repeat domain-containing protein [Streptomyces sp. 1222.5]|uniref:FG-GAP repeat domain-containing protein n=1 Tax=Streptomyces sp. 1222.5 TaxID=1881026 RepID=UPI003EBA45EC
MASRKAAPGTGGNGNFLAAKKTDPELTNFRGSATNPNDKVFAGDFNGDNRSDYLLIDISGTTSVLLNVGGGHFNSSMVTQQSSFATLALEPKAKVVVGDFNGDGKDDLAAVGDPQWADVQVALSDGTGKFTAKSYNPGGHFMAWASDDAANVVAGDFNGDGKDDLLLHGKTCWVSTPNGPCSQMIPIADATSAGFTAEEHASAFGYRQAAVNSNDNEVSHLVVGDYNADGTDDLVVFSRHKHPTQIGKFLEDSNFVSLDGTTGFGSVDTATRDLLLPKALWPGATPYAGDFNRDGKDDIIVVGKFDDTKMPVMFYQGASQTPILTDNVVESPTCVAPTCGGTNF